MKCGLRPLPQKPIDTILPKLIVNSSEIGSEFGVRQLDGSDDAARQALALTRRYNAGRVFHGLTTSTGSLRQRKMCSIIVVVTDVLVHQPPQMAFIQHDRMVEQISTAACDPALSDAILPRAFGEPQLHS
jgi:hypothetical protein